MPCYFHILWDHELDDLHDLIESLLKRRGEVMERWYRLHFGDSRALSGPEFAAVFGSELERSIPDLLRKDMEGFAAKVRAEAEELAASEREGAYAVWGPLRTIGSFSRSF